LHLYALASLASHRNEFCSEKKIISETEKKRERDKKKRKT
jgi:hypothetical protein